MCSQADDPTQHDAEILDDLAQVGIAAPPPYRQATPRGDPRGNCPLCLHAWGMHSTLAYARRSLDRGRLPLGCIAFPHTPDTRICGCTEIVPLQGRAAVR